MNDEASPATPPLSVWYGPMPESNGRTNWTAILHRGDMSEGYTIDRSEYPHRVRYAADRVRFLIGELAKEPWILDYDSDERTPCHLCGGSGERNGRPCWGLNFDDTVHFAAPQTEAKSLQPLLVALLMQLYRDALVWALGASDEFRTREQGEGAYWWRRELQQRAGLEWDGSKFVDTIDGIPDALGNRTPARQGEGPDTAALVKRAGDLGMDLS